MEVARRFGVPIVEDDAYGFLRYDGAPLPALGALDAEWVLYVGWFSKFFAPGLRVGWMIVPEQLVPTLPILKHGSDLDVATVAQRCISAFVDSGALPAHLAALRGGV